MSRYDALTRFLERHGGGEYELDVLSKAVPGGLAPSAYTWELWWKNNDPSHHHSRSWANAGLKAHPDLARQVVRFTPVTRT